LTKNYLVKIEYEIKNAKGVIQKAFEKIVGKMEDAIKNNNKFLDNIDNNLKLADPKRQLKLGYSIIKLKDRVVKSKTQVKVNDELEVILVDGILNTKINKIN
jgi:exonuclease VII large subunit